MSALLRGARQALLLLAAFLSLVNGAFISFSNCLDPGILDSNPKQLQWVPLFFDAKFNTTSPNDLEVTLYGNVSGQQVTGNYPPPDDPQWQDPNNTFGKIANIGSANKYSTLLADFKVLSYSAYDAKASEFCPHVDNETCPLGPLFHANRSDPADLHAFSIQHDFGSAYEFSTFGATIRVISGDSGGEDLACVSANITPDLGPRVAGLIAWLPAAILILKGVATLSAAIWSPWGSSDIFKWSSNYGRDEDLLRLVTPGFGDCLQYIQFVALMGCLSLQYPGFFQPAVSQVSWSLLLFNESYVSHGNGTQSLQDGIYVTNGKYGITKIRELVGMTEDKDIWACMAVWLAVIAAIVLVLCQLGFLARWIYRTATKTSEEDLRSKNLPFTIGNMVRLLFNYFILPIVALSLFQLVISTSSPASVVACAVVLFVILVVAGGWILRVIFSTKPRTYLFDDMPTVLLYGPLYNTYSDSAAPFALVPVLITFMRGVAFGAVQPSGTAQIIILAICEVILILTLNGFRPFQKQTSNNAYHTFFASVRLITVLLSIAFVPSLGVQEAPRGWIGYAILLLHACVLVFAFFLNAAQTLIEVACRSLGIAGNDAHGAVRGSILSWRMLKKRQARPADRSSTTSGAAILRTSQQGEEGRSRSMSASSQMLLNQSHGTPSTHRMSGFDNFSNGGEPIGSSGNDTEQGYSQVSGGKQSGLGVKTEGDNYYRPPRKRAATLEALGPGVKSRSAADPDVPYQDSPSQVAAAARDTDSPAPAYFRDRADSEGTANGRTDYAVREVDQYYRGAALSDQPTRKLKTGPADPTGPAANAQSWFQQLKFGVLGKKKKEAGKGFEVVRSSRAPPGMQHEGAADEGLEMETSPPMNEEPYRDSPEMKHSNVQAAAGAERPRSPSEGRERGGVSAFHFGFDNADDRSDSALPNRDEFMHPGLRAERPSRDLAPRPSRDAGASSKYDSHDERASSVYADEGHPRSEIPSLGPIESVGGIDIPSRFNADAPSRWNSRRSTGSQNWLHDVEQLNWNPHDRAAAAPAPTHHPSSSRDRVQDLRQRTTQPQVPRRSSRRTPSGEVPQSDISRLRSQSPDRTNDNQFEGFEYGAGDERHFANTSHHRAADSITRNSLGANVAQQAAEFMPGSVDEGDGFGGRYGHQQR